MFQVSIEDFIGIYLNEFLSLNGIFSLLFTTKLYVYIVPGTFLIGNISQMWNFVCKESFFSGTTFLFLSLSLYLHKDKDNSHDQTIKFIGTCYIKTCKKIWKFSS